LEPSKRISRQGDHQQDKKKTHYTDKKRIKDGPSDKFQASDIILKSDGSRQFQKFQLDHQIGLYGHIEELDKRVEGQYQ
jgi:hypothetical protein